MSIQKFYAAIEAPHVQTITLACVELSFEFKKTYRHETGNEDGCKYKAFLNDHQLEFIILEFDSGASPEIGIAHNGVPVNYKILDFLYSESNDVYFIKAVSPCENSDYWEEHNFLIKVM